MLECVINVSCGNDASVIDALASSARSSLLDVHSDPHHNRSVFTLAGAVVESDARRLAEVAVAFIDMEVHSGVHPCIGSLDVVPFVPLFGTPLSEAITARNDFAAWIAGEHGVPAFLYGPERTLPEIRRRAFDDLGPDHGTSAHRRAGACAVGARDLLVAYNIWLARSRLDEARTIARALRNEHVRALGLAVGNEVQVSLNLVSPERFGPAEAWDAVARFARIERAELVGLAPASVVQRTPRGRLRQLDLDEERTIEARLAVIGGRR